MTFYRVSFYKHLLSSDGHPFRCLQQSVTIGRASSTERAVLAAKHRFERRRGIPAWDLHADDIDVDISENGLGYMPSHSANPLPYLGQAVRRTFKRKPLCLISQSQRR